MPELQFGWTQVRCGRCTCNDDGHWHRNGRRWPKVHKGWLSLAAGSGYRGATFTVAFKCLMIIMVHMGDMQLGKKKGAFMVTSYIINGLSRKRLWWQTNSTSYSVGRGWHHVYFTLNRRFDGCGDQFCGLCFSVQVTNGGIKEHTGIRLNNLLRHFWHYPFYEKRYIFLTKTNLFIEKIRNTHSFHEWYFIKFLFLSFQLNLKWMSFVNASAKTQSNVNCLKNGNCVVSLFLKNTIISNENTPAQII